MPTRAHINHPQRPRAYPFPLSLVNAQPGARGHETSQCPVHQLPREYPNPSPPPFLWPEPGASDDKTAHCSQVPMSTTHDDSLHTTMPFPCQHHMVTRRRSRHGNQTTMDIIVIHLDTLSTSRAPTGTTHVPPSAPLSSPPNWMRQHVAHTPPRFFIFLFVFMKTLE